MDIICLLVSDLFGRKVQTFVILMLFKFLCSTYIIIIITSVTPIVIGALGVISKKFTQCVDLLDSHDVKYFHLQRFALLGTASILLENIPNVTHTKLTALLFIHQ